MTQNLSPNLIKKRTFPDFILVPLSLNLLFVFLSILNPFSNYVWAQEFIEPSNQVTFGSKLHTNRDIFYQSLVDGQENIYLIGTTEDDFTFNDLVVFKLDTDLNQLWSKNISINTDFSYDRLIDAYLDSNDNLLMFIKSAYTKAEEALIVLKLNPEGDELWRKPLSDISNPTSVAPDLNVSHLDENDILHISFAPWIPDTSATDQFYLELDSSGDIVAEKTFDDLNGFNKRIVSEISFNNGFYHTIKRENVDIEPYNEYTYLKFNKDTVITEIITLNEKQRDFLGRSENSFFKFDSSGKAVLYVPHYFYFNSINHRGYSLYYFDASGQLDKIVEHDESKEKYFIGVDYSSGHLHVVSNSRSAGTTDPLLLSIETYDTNGNLIFSKSEAFDIGERAFLKEDRIGVFTETNIILWLDYQFNLLEEIPLNDINSPYFEPNGLLYIDGNSFLGGTMLSPIYEGSDFVSQRDISFKKANSTGEIGHFIFSGQGTSKSYANRSLQKDTEGNFILAISEKTGPDNLDIGGSRSPEIDHILKYSPEFELLEKQTGVNNEIWIDPPENTVYFEMEGVEHYYEYSSGAFRLYKNDLLQWSFPWNGGGIYAPSNLSVGKGGVLAFKSSQYGSANPALNVLTLDQQLYRLDVNKNPERIQVLDNNWVFVINDISIDIYTKKLELIRSSPLMHKNTFKLSNYAPILQKNNVVAIHTSFDNKLHIYNQFGEEVDEYFLNGDLRSKYSMVVDGDLIVLGHEGRFINREYSWIRSSLSRYVDFITRFMPDRTEEDTDADGVVNANDQCPDTPFGNPVNEVGCNILKISENNFLVEAFSERCPDQNNGIILITAQASSNYKAVLFKDDLEVSSEDFNDSISFFDLSPGVYDICIFAEDLVEFEQCFQVSVAAKEKLFVDSKVNHDTGKLDINLSGDGPFTIAINDKVFNTSENHISLDLSQNANILKVSTENQCQGSFERVIMLNGNLVVYPNPVGNEALKIFTGTNSNERIVIKLYDTKLQQITTRVFQQKDGIALLSMDGLAPGLYFITLETGNSIFSSKIIKR